jgi:sterol 3beta-glucosyltransferase
VRPRTPGPTRRCVSSVVCPFQADQHFWGAAVHRAGAGPEPLPAKKLTVERLASAIRAMVEDGGKRSRAVQLSERIGREDGPGKASEQIESALAERARSQGRERLTDW